jgi:SAM-dependent methyltransferase
MDTRDFYDSLAPYYEFIYKDWESSVIRQGSELDSIIREFCRSSGRSILDVSCGIGTQAIGLARLGYEVTASDLSAREIEQARREATRFGVEIDFSVADMREAHRHHSRQFDVVLSADNSVPHLLSDEDILQACKEFYRCTKPGGVCLISLRDYEVEEMESGVIRPYAIHEQDGQKYLMFQTWDVKGHTYEVSLYCVEDKGAAECRTSVMRSEYYAISVDRMISLLRQAAFADPRRLDGRFFQPLIVAHKQGE